MVVEIKPRHASKAAVVHMTKAMAQVMAAASKLAGYSLGQADLLRRAMGKKDKEKMAKERATFIAGCASLNKIPEKKANAIFDLLEKFAGYNSDVIGISVDTPFGQRPFRVHVDPSSDGAAVVRSDAKVRR